LICSRRPPRHTASALPNRSSRRSITTSMR
jgi:hypothetical protein